MHVSLTRKAAPAYVDLDAHGHTWDWRGLTQRSSLVQFYVLVIHRIVIDAAVRRRDPRRHLAGLMYAVHQAQNEGLVALTGQPLLFVRSKLLHADGHAFGRRRHAGPVADASAEARAGQAQAKRMPGLLDQPVPALHADLAVAHVRAAGHLIHRIAHGDLFALRA